MALATLCLKLQRNRRSFCRPHFHAFIVDHKARPRSHEEATKVAFRLRKMGMHFFRRSVCHLLTLKGLNSTVLGLEWPSEVQPSELSNFETQARRLRYRALGIACRDMNIRHLLLAHHSDDQAESMLMKVAEKGEHIWSLRSIGDSEINIPECWGIHGVHESGLREFQARVLERALHSERAVARNDGQDTISMKPVAEGVGIQCEDGGVKLYRPLMHFSKRRLETTCRKHQVKWIEDETNQEVTRTPRNAVRSLLKDKRLPIALSKESLLALTKSLVNKIKGHQIRAETLLRRTKVLSLDLRSGRLLIRLPKRLRSYRNIPEAYLDRELSAARTRATVLLMRFVSSVTPLEHVKLPSLHAATKMMYPELLGSHAPSQDIDMPPPKLTLGGVLLQRIRAPIEPTEPEHGAHLVHNLDPDFVWSLTREPCRRSALPCITIPPAQQNPPPEPYLRSLALGKTDSRSSWSAWQLWDGRYWIRISNHTNADLIVRPFRENDLQVIKQETPPSHFRAFKEELRTAAPEAVRWTLPVIAETTHSERPLALPTLRYRAEPMPGDLQWEIRYKHIDLGKRRDESCIIR